jgi:hypothetical protein
VTTTVSVQRASVLPVAQLLPVVGEVTVLTRRWSPRFAVLVVTA